MTKEYFVTVPEESASERSYFTETATPSGSSISLPAAGSEPYYIPQEMFDSYRKSNTANFTEEYELK
jgi:hypothetical protein